MFGSLNKNSIFYILDKNNKPTVKVGKVTDAKVNPQFYGLANQEIDITVEVNGETYEFKKIPANTSIISPSAGIIISDNADDMIREYDTMVSASKQILDSVDYHKFVIDSKDEIMSILNPRYAKEKEQENKIASLENRMGGIENGIENIKNMMAEILKTKGEN